MKMFTSTILPHPEALRFLSLSKGEGGAVSGQCRENVWTPSPLERGGVRLNFFYEKPLNYE